MNILERYIARAVAGATLLVLTILLMLYAFANFVNELDKVGRGTYSVWVALEYVVLGLPRRVGELFPSCALLGTMLGLGALASSSELVAIRAAGVSLARIAAAVLKVGAILMLGAYPIADQLAPKAEQIAQGKRAVALGKPMGIESGMGFWARDGDRYINIRKLYPEGRLEQIRIFELDPDRRLREVTRAASGRFRQTHWWFEGISIGRLGKDRSLTLETRAGMPWTSLLSPDLLNVVLVEVDNLSAAELWGYVEYLRANRLDAIRYETAFWAKLAAPLTIGVMMFVAIPFAFGPLRAAGMGQRLLVGGLLGIGFFIIDNAFRSFGQVAHVEPLVSALLPTGVFLLFGVWMMRRVN
jgi:lipopolysaccharide export system permease protein